ncbi:MAG: hypothetical protein IT352_15555 [Gemmatimonadales bacterium]|nr:hypothetical protein [Gemmatimonadales bacterium]
MRWIGIAMAGLLVGCGSKGDDAKNAIAAVGAVASGDVQDRVEEAEKFRQDRIARGDTVAMAYSDLQKYLPESVAGLEPDGDPSGQSQSMAGFSMSQTERRWVGPEGPEGSSRPEVKVSIVDFGGSQQGYAMLAAPLLMGFSREDDQEKVGSVKMDLAHTGGWLELRKDTKNVAFTAVTRYRFVIKVEAEGFGEDKSDLARSVAEDVARKLSDK